MAPWTPTFRALLYLSISCIYLIITVLWQHGELLALSNETQRELTSLLPLPPAAREESSTHDDYDLPPPPHHGQEIIPEIIIPKQKVPQSIKMAMVVKERVRLRGQSMPIHAAIRTRQQLQRDKTMLPNSAARKGLQKRRPKQPPPQPREQRPDPHYALPTPRTKNSTSYLIIHVGPPKTATTTLQFGLERFNETLFSADGILYDYLETPTGPWVDQLRKRQCHARMQVFRQDNPESTVRDWMDALPCWKRMIFNLRQHRHMYNIHSWLYSNENFAIGLIHQPLDWDALQQTLAAFDIHFMIVVTYRRYAPWLYSSHRHVSKYTGRKPAWSLWPDEAAIAERRGIVLPFVETALEHAHATGESIFLPFEYTDQVVAKLPTTLDVRILNLHDDDDYDKNGASNKKSPMTHLLCDVLGHDITPNACAASRAADQEDGATVHLNSAASEENDAQRPTISNYDRIIVDAYLAGMLDQMLLTRREAGLWARDWHQNALQESEADLPMECPAQGQVEALWELILVKELQVGQLMQHAVSAQQLRQEFDDLVAYPRMCLANTAPILHNSTWNALWTLLNDPATQPLPGYVDF